MASEVVGILGWILLISVLLLIVVAYLTLAERKVSGAAHLRRGPNVVGPFGLLQPIADGIKLLTKETIVPTRANRVIFLLAPIVTFGLALVAWAVIPVGERIVLADLNIGLLYLFAVSSLAVYGIIMAGWASNSVYPFLGALRSAAQMVSYEISIGFVIVTVVLCAGSLNLSEIVLAQQGGWYVLPLLPMAVVFFVSALAETNRTPFDLPEDEAALVAGYATEYSSLLFGLFMLGEYAAMVSMSAMGTLLFLGGWLAPIDAGFLSLVPGPVWFVLKTVGLLFMFLWIRATLPRYRYDQLMRIGWKVFLPLSLLWVVLTAGFLLATDRLPG